MEAQSKKISNCRCHFDRFFTLIGEGINQRDGKGGCLAEFRKKLSETGVILPLIPHIGVAGRAMAGHLAEGVPGGRKAQHGAPVRIRGAAAPEACLWGRTAQGSADAHDPEVL